MHKENDGLIILALFGKRELIKCLECLGLDLTEGDGMAWWMDGRLGNRATQLHYNKHQLKLNVHTNKLKSSKTFYFCYFFKTTNWWCQTLLSVLNLSKKIASLFNLSTQIVSASFIDDNCLNLISVNLWNENVIRLVLFLGWYLLNMILHI